MKVGQGREPFKSAFVVILAGQKELSTLFFKVNIFTMNGVVDEDYMTGILYDGAVLLSEETKDFDEPGQGTDVWKAKDREDKDKESRLTEHGGRYKG